LGLNAFGVERQIQASRKFFAEKKVTPFLPSQMLNVKKISAQLLPKLLPDY
jgi:hypothetical protein